MRPRATASAAIAVVLAVGAGLLQTAAQPPRQTDVVSLVPPGAALVLQARDFSELVRDWNGSPEKTKWLASENYQAFSRSRLFLRLQEAYGEFAAAAGVPVNMTLVSEVAGNASTLALYDIGKLEFLYITRLPQVATVQNALWQARGTFEPRQAAGTPFYVRKDPEAKRLVAFGVRDGYLLLATREDLLAGALALIGGQGGGTSVATEGWFAKSVAAAQTTGDVRLVMNLEALVKEPHFRSYWVQRNVTELKPFAAGVSDVFRTATEIREERVLVRGEEKAATIDGGTRLGEMVRLVPTGAGTYRAWVSPSAAEASSLILRKILAPRAATGGPDRVAPSVVLTSGMVGSEGDLETRIDEEVRTPRVVGFQTGALEQLIGGAPPTALLQVESTRMGADGVFVDRGSVIVVARQGDWPVEAAREAVRTAVEPVWTKARLGLRWNDVRIGNQTVSQMEGLEPIAIAVRGPLLFVATDPGLLASMLELVSRPPVALPGVYAGGFRHAIERERFARLMRFVDYGVAGGGERGPTFFSGNLGSLSNTLSRVDEATIVVRESPASVAQTVTYRVSR